MVTVHEPIREKLTLVWHNHFATSAVKVKYARYTGPQNQKLPSLELGDFCALAYAMPTDSAMPAWLDGKDNVGASPNANLAQGTDHRTAGPVFIAGVPVRGGCYGEEPSLTDLDDGDLKGTTDFRDIYHKISGTSTTFPGHLPHFRDIYHKVSAKTPVTDPEPAVGPGRRDSGFL